MSATVCPKCHGPRKVGFGVCWKCHVHEREQRAFQDGYADGFRAGMRLAAPAPARPVLDTKRWRQLMQLAHPDKHGGSPTATEVTQWLAQVRPS